MGRFPRFRVMGMLSLALRPEDSLVTNLQLSWPLSCFPFGEMWEDEDFSLPLSLSLSLSVSRSRCVSLSLSGLSLWSLSLPLSLSLHTLGPPEGSRPEGRESPMCRVCWRPHGFRGACFGWAVGPELYLMPTLCPIPR